MTSSNKQTYSLLNNDPRKTDNVLDEFPPDKCATNTWRLISFALLLFLLLEHITVVLLGHTALGKYVRISNKEIAASPLSGYPELAQYNTSEVFIERLDLADRSSLDYWLDLLRGDGIVAVDTEWAMRQNLTPSAAHPENATQSIYQVDVFHALHCLNRIRVRLVSHLSPEKWQRDDDHTLHCVDYLRQSLMCNADLTLKASKDLTAFTANHEHQCRDYSALGNWIEEHSWEGYREWLENHNSMASMQ